MGRRRSWIKAESHRTRDKRIYETKTEIRERILLVKGAKCVRCGEIDLSLLQFHHIDPTTKLKNVTEFISSYHWNPTWENWNKLVREVNKCVVLCKKCHTEYHQGIWTMDIKGIVQR